MFRKKPPPRPKGPPARDPLIAVPEFLPGVEVKCDKSGLAQLRRPTLSSDSVADWFSTKLKFKRDRFYNLDEQGSLYVSLVDGKRSLRMIAQALSEEFKLERKEAHHAVVEFTQLLMLRGCIGINPDGAKKKTKKKKPQQPTESHVE